MCIAGLAVSTPSLAEVTPQQIEAFLRSAEVVAERPAGNGVTGSLRLTLRRGEVTHDAHFQSIDIRRQMARVGRKTEIAFADSYHFNIAAYELAKLLGLDHMVPVTVERAWRERPGALSWWLDVAWDESTRLDAGARPTDVQRWSWQLNDMKVFAQLVHDTDRNRGNVLYTADWNLWMIDFTRAFRPWGELPDPASLTHCDRRLFERLQAVTLADVREAVGKHLSLSEARAVIERRDLIVDHFRTLIARRGAERVLYDPARPAVRSDTRPDGGTAALQ